jgi:hypothetical protein
VVIVNNIEKLMSRVFASNVVLVKRFVLVVLLSALSTQAFAWQSKAKKLFEDDEYEACIELTEKYKKNNQANMFLAFSHLQENVFNKTKYDKEKFKAYNMRLEAKLGINDIDELLYFVGLSDKPYVVKEARSLAKKVFKNISDIDDVPKLVSFLKVEDEDTRKLALSSIKRILKPKRDYVKKGGTLREKDYDVMRSKTLIKALVGQLPLGDAKSALVLVEEPALPYLSEAASVESAALEAKINKAIASRQKKYPESNWHSAVGKKR